MKEWSDPERVAEYLSREIPHRHLAEAMLLQALPAQVDRFLDLGTGDGRLIGLVRSAHPQAEAVGLDSSQPMLDRAAQRFPAASATDLRVHDLRQPLLEIGAFDAIVSGLAIHHLEDDRKRGLFAEVRRLLAPSGVFANLDLVEAATPELHERFRHEIGRPEDDPADRLAGLCDQLDWLRAAGFADVDCQFKWLQLTLVVGTAA
jgi:tRNA (cmo5U34)-methyltransferase